MDTPTAVRLSRQAHALDLLQAQLQTLQSENASLRSSLTERTVACTELRRDLAGMRAECDRLRAVSLDLQSKLAMAQTG